MIIVTFSEKRSALAFSDYLRSQGIANRVQPGDGGFTVTVEAADDAPRALVEAEAFVANPADRKYRAASWQTGSVQDEAVYGASPPIALGWWRQAGWGTRGVALACLAVFLGLLVDDKAVFGLLRFPEGISLAAVGVEWWRLLSPALLHFSLLHITFNLLWWWEFGSLIERYQSTARLLALTLVIALVSNAAQFLSYGPGFGGLSAVVYGLLGYLWLYPYADPGAPFRLHGGIVLFMIGWLALGYTGLFDALFGIRISNDGHLAGLLAGAALGVLLGLVNYRRPAVADDD